MAEIKVKTFDEFIIKAKQEMKLKKINLQDLADITGVPRSTIAKIFCGTTKYPQDKTVKALAKGLDIDISEIDMFKSKIPHNRFNPNIYFKEGDFETFLNESINKVNEAKKQMDEILGLLLTIKRGTELNEDLKKEISEQ